MILVLIGYRGTGKSTVGRFLSKRLRIPYVSLDREIEKKAGMSIPEIVERHGWDRFRELETEVTRRFCSSDRIILDTGGGVIERPENIEVLRANGTIFWLKASTDTVISRIRHGANRPALSSEKSFLDEVAEILERRTPIYRSVADYEIDTDDATLEQVATKITEIWARVKGSGR